MPQGLASAKFGMEALGPTSCQRASLLLILQMMYSDSAWGCPEAHRPSMSALRPLSTIV